MSIPDYQSIMLPLLLSVSSGTSFKINEVRERLAVLFELTPNERRELLPSGSQPIFDNRVAWAKTYLLKAGLLESPQRAQIKITKRGSDILQKNPNLINVAFLKQFNEFNEFIGSTNKINPTTTIVEDELDAQTPVEKIDALFDNLKQKLAQELMQ